jgi:hypothetical protein
VNRALSAVRATPFAWLSAKTEAGSFEPASRGLLRAFEPRGPGYAARVLRLARVAVTSSATLAGTGS